MHIAKQSARGSIVLFSGNLLATLISAVSSIVVARLLGPSDFGLFSLSLVAPTLLQLFTHFGTRTAVTKYVAEQMALGNVERARRFAQSAMIFSILAGAVLAVVNFLASGWMAAVLFQRPELQLYIALASVYLFGQSIVLTVIATATGWYAMGQASFANILQAALRLAIAPFLVLLGFGVAGAVWGHALSFLIGGLISAAILYATKVKFMRERLSSVMDDTKELIKFGFQPFLGGVLAGLSTFYVSVLLALVAGNTAVGFYQTATNLIVPVSLLSAATASALYPAFASLRAIEADTGQAFGMSVKYVSFFIGPVLFFLAAASTELINFFYGSPYVPGSQYLFLLALANTPILLGSSVIPNFLNGIGRPRLTFVAGGVAAIVLFVAAPLFSVFSGLAVNGLIAALFVSNASMATVGLYLVHRNKLGVTGWWSTLAIFAASLVALGVCLVLPSIGHQTVMLVVKFMVFVAIYLTLAPLFGALELADLDRLAQSIGDVTFLLTLASPFIRYEKFCVRLRLGGHT